MYISSNRICQLLRILGILLKNLAQYRKINLFRNAKTFRLTVDKVRYIYHHVGKHLDKSFLCLYPHKRNCSILNCLSHLQSHFLTLRSKNFTAERINNVFRQNLISDSVFQGKLFVKFITSNLRKVISSGIKEHRSNKIFRAVQAERLTRTNLAVKLLQAFLIILRRILRKTGMNLRFITKQFQNFLIRANTKRTNKHRNGHLSCSIYTNIENIIGIRLVLQPCSSIWDHCT